MKHPEDHQNIFLNVYRNQQKEKYKKIIHKKEKRSL